MGKIWAYGLAGVVAASVPTAGAMGMAQGQSAQGGDPPFVQAAPPRWDPDAPWTDLPGHWPFVLAEHADQITARSLFRSLAEDDTPRWSAWLAPNWTIEAAWLPLQLSTRSPTGTAVSQASPPLIQFHSMAGWRSVATHGDDAILDDQIYTYGRVQLPTTVHGNGVPWGSKINLNLFSAPAPGDFLPPSPTIGGSSVALLPPNSANARTWWQSAMRPTVNGLVDLVTGVPLVQVTDMELPFGNAVFRLNRTRSATPESMMRGMAANHSACDRWWDWTGLGWMTSENPVLLIDSAVPDLVGGRERTIWLWLDAHHAIPFQRVLHAASGTVEYEAPPRFRAKLRHNGVWRGTRTDPAPPRLPGDPPPSTEWIKRPTKYEISLYDGALTYTFLPVYQNVPPHVWNTASMAPTNSPAVNQISSYHERPLRNRDLAGTQGGSTGGGAIDNRALRHSEFDHALNPGFGLPYIGLLYRIEDRYGHQAEMTYEPVRRVNADLPGTPHVEFSEESELFGALRSVKLSSLKAGVRRTDWTLMYAYQRHRGHVFGINAAEQGTPLHHKHVASSVAISGIYAHKGDVPNPEHDGWRRVFDAGEPVPQATGVMSGWVRAVTYQYGHTGPYGAWVNGAPPILVRTTMERRDAGPQNDPAIDNQSVESRWYLWDLGGQETVGFGAFAKRTPWLSAILTQRDVDEMRPNWSDSEVTVDTALIQLGRLGGHDPLEMLTPLSRKRLEAWASVSWQRSKINASDRLGSVPDERPDFNSIVDDHRLELNYGLGEEAPAALMWDMGYDTVAKLSLRTASGREVYRFSRLLSLPNRPLRPVARSALEGLSNLAPGRSLLLAPFSFRAHTPAPWSVLAGEDQESALVGSFALEDEKNLAAPRFTVLVDTFALPKSADPSFEPPTGSTTPQPEPPPQYDAESGLMPGQTGRRVVRINPAGYILRDRNILIGKDALGQPVRLGLDAASTSQPGEVGGGLGEEFIYRPASAMFSGIDWATVAPRSLKDELFKSERRTLGWSAAERAGTGGTDGLVEYWDYRLVDVAGGAPNEKRVELAQQGTQRGIESDTSQPQAKSASFLVVEGEFEATTFHARVDFSTFLTPAQAEALRPTILSKPALQVFLLQMAHAGHRVSASLTVHRAPDSSVTPLPPLRQRPAAETWSLGTPRPINPQAQSDRSTWKFPITRQLFDANGRSEWSLVAMVANPLTATPNPANTHGDIVMLTYTAFWEEHNPSVSNDPPPGYTSESVGRPRHIVVAARPGEPAKRSHLWGIESGGSPDAGPQVAVSVSVPQPPDGFWLPTAAPVGTLPQVTSMYYDQWGVSDTVHPDGRLTMRRIRAFRPPSPGSNPNPEFFAREFILNDVALVGESGAWKVFGESQVNDYAGRQPVGEPAVKRRGTWLANVDPATQEHGAYLLSPATFAETAQEKLTLDSNGRVQRAAAMEWVDGQGNRAVGSTLVNDLGEVHRTLELDGTITRLTRNALGQTLRRYVGTADLGWGERLPVSSNSFNMVLVERHEYGMGISDAWQPTVRWTYTSHPAWAQTAYVDTASTAADQTGTATVTGYDWRMRPVKEERYAKGRVEDASVRTSTTLRYLDHLGRERRVVTLGERSGPLPDGVDPTRFALDSEAPLPPLVSFATLNPLSVVDTFYFADGLVHERRRYDVANLHPDVYHRETSYFGIAGAETFGYASGQPARATRLDGHGRAIVVSTQAVGPGGQVTELTRTTTTYDAAGNVASTEFRDRKDGQSGLMGSAAEVEVRVTRNFYDPLKRLMARVDGDVPAGLRSILTNPVEDAHGATPALQPPVVTGAAAPTAPTTFYWYNRMGQQVAMQDPNGIVTRQRFGWNGQLVSTLENATPTAEGQLQRETSHFSRLGRLEGVSSGEPGGIKTGEWFKYGAEVVDHDFAVVSAHGGMIGSVHSGAIPDGFNIRGPPSGMRERLRFRYTFDGLIAERITFGNVGEAAVSLRYTYDDQRRLIRVRAGHYSNGTSLTHLNWQVGFADGVSVLATVGAANEHEYAYDHRGNLIRASSRVVMGGTPRPVTEVVFRYDLRGRLTGERIAHDRNRPAGWPWPVSGDPPDAVIYVWSWAGEGAVGGAHHRLDRIGYPHHQNVDVGGDRRWVEVQYDAESASVSNLLSRASRLVTWTGSRTPAAELTAAGVTHTGSGSRLATRLLGVQQGATAQYAVHGDHTRDHLGRLIRRTWHNASGHRLLDQQNGYDAGGRRITSRVDRFNPLDPSGTAPLGERFTDKYDDLGRLIRSDLTKRVAGTSSDEPWRVDRWALDVHGHWAADLSSAVRQYGRSTTNPDGLRQVTLDNGPTRTIAWSGVAPSADQTISQAWTGVTGQSALQAEGAGFGTAPVEDGAGNVRFCGEFLYAFDAWNRLVAVWKARPDSTFNANSYRPRADAPHDGMKVGNWVKRFRYDALGRLIEVRSPMAGPEWPDAVLQRVERFWYDGSRRIQEVTLDPIDLVYVVNEYGNQGLIEYITTGLIGALQGAPTGLPFRVLNREYIWGAGVGGGVDELHVYFDRERRPWGVLQDSDGDNVAVVDDGGAVVAEFVYDPYGAVIGQRSYGVHPPLKAGHRGLFAESLTVGTVGMPDENLGDPIATASAWVDGRVLVPNERVLYHMRNRAYDPGPSGATAGRFLQRDPNADVPPFPVPSAMRVGVPG